MRNTLRMFLRKLYRLLFARRLFRFLNAQMHALALRGLGVLNFENDRVSGERSFLRRFLGEHPRDIIFDVGAHAGEYALRVLEIQPTALVYCFEPHPKTFRRLMEALGTSSALAYNVACGSTAGSIALYDYSTNDGSEHASVFREVITGIHDGVAVEHIVEQITIDEFLTANGIMKVDLLKIDTEGNELEVLKGCKSAIKEGKIDAIQFEFNEMNIASRVFFRDFCELLKGFAFYRLLPDSVLPLGAYNPVTFEIFAYQNILALRESGEGRAESASRMEDHGFFDEGADTPTDL